MDDTVLLEELHLTLRLPAGLPAERAAAVAAALGTLAFRGRLGVAVAALLADLGLAEVTFEIDR